MPVVGNHLHNHGDINDVKKNLLQPCESLYIWIHVSVTIMIANDNLNVLYLLFNIRTHHILFNIPFFNIIFFISCILNTKKYLFFLFEDFTVFTRRNNTPKCCKCGLSAGMCTSVNRWLFYHSPL